MTKIARPDHPIHDLLRRRFSPYGFDSRPVAVDELRSLFEAARWAASSFNEQPWRYIVATRADETEFERLLGCLVEGNQAWARHAPVLALAIARLDFTRNGKPNRVAYHDLGLAAGNLTLEATARGLAVHQMAGILPDVARRTYGIPEGFEPFTALAIGHAADPAGLPDDLKARDTAPRERRPLAEFVFAGQWEQPAELDA